MRARPPSARRPCRNALLLLTAGVVLVQHTPTHGPRRNSSRGEYTAGAPDCPLCTGTQSRVHRPAAFPCRFCAIRAAPAVGSGNQSPARGKGFSAARPWRRPGRKSPAAMLSVLSFPPPCRCPLSVVSVMSVVSRRDVRPGPVDVLRTGGGLPGEGYEGEGQHEHPGALVFESSAISNTERASNRPDAISGQRPLLSRALSSRATHHRTDCRRECF